MSAGEQHRAETGRVLLLLLVKDRNDVFQGAQRTVQADTEHERCFFPNSKKIQTTKRLKTRRKKKKERKEDIYEELWHFHCHLPLIFRLICFQGLWVSLRWRICIKSTWWFCHDLYLKPYPLNYTAVIWQKDDWINEGLLQYSWFEKLENNTSLCPQEIWLFH